MRWDFLIIQNRMRLDRSEAARKQRTALYKNDQSINQSINVYNRPEYNDAYGPVYMSTRNITTLSASMGCSQVCGTFHFSRWLLSSYAKTRWDMA